MSEPYQFAFRDENDVTIVSIQGYFSAQSGKDLQKAVRDRFRQGRLLFVLDFSPCKLVNSPGVASLMDLTLKIIDDYKGRLAVCGLNPLKREVFEMIGILPMAIEAGDTAEALEKITA